MQPRIKCYQAISKHNTVPFKSKLTVRYESRFLTRFAIPARIKNRESKRSYRESRRESSLAGQKVSTVQSDPVKSNLHVVQCIVMQFNKIQ